jgi:hypothetical protein
MLGRSLKGEIVLPIDGQDWRLVLDINALADFEQVTGKQAFGLFDDLDKGTVGIIDLRALFWAALQKHHRGTDLLRAGELLGAAPEAMAALLDKALPDAKADAGNPPPPMAAN